MGKGKGTTSTKHNHINKHGLEDDGHDGGTDGRDDDRDVQVLNTLGEADRVSWPGSGTRRSRPGYNGISAQRVELAIAPGSLARQIQRPAKLLAGLAHC